MVKTVSIPMSNIMSRMSLDVQITGLRVHYVRRVVALWLIKLAARVLGTKRKVEVHLH